VDLVGDFFFGQADERTAQQSTQGKGVAPVGDGPCHRDQVLDFLAVEESLARLGGDWDGAAFQRPLIDPQAGPRRRQQGDVAGPRLSKSS